MKQQWDPKRYADTARYVSDLGMPVVELLAPRPGERILDLGCGDGALTLKLQDMGCRVIGVDASPQMIDKVQSLGLDARVADGAALAFDGEFDAVFSNAALHWMKAPDKVIAGVWRALVPGGRFVGELGGYGNVGAIVEALEAAVAVRGVTVECPWYFPRPEAYRGLLEAQGFGVKSIDLIPRPTPLPGDIADWLANFGEAYTAALPAAEQPALIAEVTEVLRPVLADEDGRWTADYVRLRFSAFKPE